MIIDVILVTVVKLHYGIREEDKIGCKLYNKILCQLRVRTFS